MSSSKFGRIPDAWKMPALAFPAGVIGGGAVRDYLLGVTPRDTDLFVPYTADAMKAIALLDAKLVNSSASGDEESVAYVFEQPGQSPLNIIVMGSDISLDPSKLLSRFDFGICRADYPGHL